MTHDSIGAWIREERKAGKMNQTELGELVGASQVDISTWETGKRLPDEATVAALEELFGSKAPERQMASPEAAPASPKKRAQPTLEELRAKAPKGKAKKKRKTETTDYRHENETRTNIPPAKIAAEGTVPKVEKAKYAYNPHLPPVLRFDPTGQADRFQDLIAEASRRTLTEAEQSELREATSHYEPWLEWAGKREEHERGFFEVDPVALHIHERVAAQAIVRTAMREDVQRDLFADPEQPYHEAVQFYRHDVDWTNRLILGDSLQVMSSLAKREGLAGKVQAIFVDPPYGINYGSNFQSDAGKRDVKDTERDLTREPEMIRAYRDTWSLGKHSYLTYLDARLRVAHELLSSTGSLFFQISEEHLHLARSLFDQVFGADNLVAHISFKKVAGRSASLLDCTNDYLLWFAKDRKLAKYRQLYLSKKDAPAASQYDRAELPNGHIVSAAGLSPQQDKNARRFMPDQLQSQGATKTGGFAVAFEGRSYGAASGYHWKTRPEGVDRLRRSERLIKVGSWLKYRRFLDDFRVVPLSNVWEDTVPSAFSEEDRKRYVVRTAVKVVTRCLLMTTDPGDLVFDPTCGSGTTAFVAEKYGRRWITTDTSRVALVVARQRLLTAKYLHFKTRAPVEPVSADPGDGFIYAQVPHIELSAIGKNTNLDPIFEKHEPILKERLAVCEKALAKVGNERHTRLAAKLKDKQNAEGKKAITDADRRRWLLPPENRDRSEKVRKAATVDLDAPTWFEWEVPFDTDPDWPPELQDAVTAYREAWRAKMDEVNECIAANADQEELVDQPEVVRGVLRVSGPFTVEGVRPEELSIGEKGLFDGTPNTFEESAGEEEEAVAQAGLQNLSAYLTKMVQLLRSDGVTFPNNQHRAFARVDPLFESSDSGGGLIHAEGIWEGEDEGAPDHVGVGFGPQYGPVTALQVEELIRASRRYDELVIAGFSFDAAASAVIQESSHPRLQIHQAYIRPDVNPAMDGLLKETPNSQLFTVFGQPEIETSQNGDGEWVCELVGVDIYNPLTSEVRSTGASKVAAWFLDQDYDGRCFCITQAFFPDQKAWDKIAKALGSSADPEAFAAFEGTESLPFKAGKYNRVAVKVIDPRGNEVMAIRQLGEGD